MLGMSLSPIEFLRRVGQELSRINPQELQALADAIWATFLERRFIFVIGNGGSGSNASPLLRRSRQMHYLSDRL